jgi:hypothetical protein
VCGSKRSECLFVQIMDASRVLGTLRAHCDRLEIELKELDADIEEAKMMVIETLQFDPPRPASPSPANMLSPGHLPPGISSRDGRERTLIALHSAPTIVTAPCNL